MRQRILVVEDDDVQQLTLKAALENCGYHVDAVSDGIEALRQMRQTRYDLALMDYQIPEIDGLASAKLMHELVGDAAMPQLVAITANSEELQTRQGPQGVFDIIVPKPYDLPGIVGVVRKQLSLSTNVTRGAAADAIWRELGLPRAPNALVIPETNAPNAPLLETFFSIDAEREPDVVIIASSDCWDEAMHLREETDFYRLPFIDATGQFGDIADARLGGFDRASLAEIGATMKRFATRIGELTPRFQRANSRADRLLAYLYASGRVLQPTRFAQSKSLVRYVGFFGYRSGLTDKLERQGLLEKAFFDRVHVCGGCDSARLNAREECPSCRSSHLREVDLIHHFKCAYQAPESEFLQGRHLTCPKCKQALRHYGSDYDKPGRVFLCAECEAVSPEVAIGFVCFDCGAHADGDRVVRRDISSYRLSDAAINLLTRSGSESAHSLPAARLPERLQDELHRLSKQPSQHCGNISVAEITYDGANRIVAKQGLSGFVKLRNIFLQNLKSALADDAALYSEADRDYLLLHSDLACLTGDLLAKCQESLAETLDPALTTIDLSDRQASYG